MMLPYVAPFRVVVTLSIYLLLQVNLSLGQVRQAPFCVDHKHEPEELANFKDIFEWHEKNGNEYVPVAPNAHQSPSGFISNVTLSHITTTTHLLPTKHSWRVFDSFLHITIRATEHSDGLEGLYIQANSAPLGVPFGEFVTNFDCGDCPHPTSIMKPYTSLIGCSKRPAAAYLHPTVLVIGGLDKPPKKFYEAHFHFRYVDYPCFDVMYAQFLIIAVRKFGPDPHFETFHSPVYQTNLEGTGAPTPMYYGWPAEDIDCHHPVWTVMDNWFPQRNSRIKVKFNSEYDECVVKGESASLGDLTTSVNLCPPGPVTCGADKGDTQPPKTISQWKKMRKHYLVQNDEAGGTELFCYDCGSYTSKIGPVTWIVPTVEIDEEEEISIIEVYTNRVIRVQPKFRGIDCERRDGFGKTWQGKRDTSKDKKGCELDFKTRLINAGYRWGKRSLKLHALLMIFAFTVGTNCLIYCARFLKEANIIDKGSGCWGIGNWLWDHMFWTYLSGAAMWGGFMMYAFQDKKVVCQLFDSFEDTEYCNRTIFPHKAVGAAAVLIFHMCYVTGWSKPKAKGMRNVMLLYHAVAGYLAKLLALGCLFLTPDADWDLVTYILIGCIEGSFVIAFIVGSIVQCWMDSDPELKTIQGRRKMFPVPEGIATHLDPPHGKLRGLLFPVFIIVQVGLFGALFLYVLRDYVRVNRTNK